MAEANEILLTELDFLKKRLGLMENIAATKQQQMNSLLEITEAVNRNMPIFAITKIYENILRAHQKVGKVMLIMKNTEQEWECVLQSENSVPVSNFSALVQSILKNKSVYKIIPSDSEDLQMYEFVFPVFHKTDPIGFALVGNVKSVENITQEEDRLKFIQTITNIVVVANENKKLFKSQLEKIIMEKEFVLAEEIQKTLIPSELPHNEKIEASAYYKAHKSIGGDYYDFIEISENEFIFCISDVSGKGISAALIMANLQANLRILATQNHSLSQLVHQLNENVLSVTKGEKYFTFFIGKINLDTRNLTYINAGHPASLLLNGKTLIPLEEGTTILGMFQMLPFIKEGEKILEKGAMILSYTDGLSEAFDSDGNLFDSDRIESFLKENSTLPVAEFNQNLIQKMTDFKQGTESDDDLTLFTIRVL